jgi:ArsR family transcriptional regulator
MRPMTARRSWATQAKGSSSTDFHLLFFAGVVIDPYIDYSRYMDITCAVNALEALAHETRLSVFRLLVQAGPTGLTAGAIADHLDARQNTMSSHLAKLHRAGIVTSERDGRHIIYRADFDAVSGLIVYLMEDCCGGNAKVCKPVAASIRC